MREPLKNSETTELRQLWRKRNRLDSGQMARMYDLVQRALREFSPPELHALGETKEELIAQFIFAKVLQLNTRPGIDSFGDGDPGSPSDAEATDDGHSAPSSSFALCAYFRRYLIDCTRSTKFRRTVAIDDDIHDNFLEIADDRPESIESHLAEFGLDFDSVSASARRFIAQLGEPERLLLCETFGKEALGGLSGVASRHAIASYHYRAGRLGLVFKRESLPGDYGKTQLGQWIEKTLKIPIAQENKHIIFSIFQILGVEASYG